MCFSETARAELFEFVYCYMMVKLSGFQYGRREMFMFHGIREKLGFKAKPAPSAIPYAAFSRYLIQLISGI